MNKKLLKERCLGFDCSDKLLTSMMYLYDIIISFLERLLSKAKTFIIPHVYPHVRFGEKTTVYFKSSIWQYSQLGGVEIGDQCLIGRTRRGYHGGMPFYTKILSDGQESVVKIGDNCRINGAYIHAKTNVCLGSNCVVASGVSIIDSNGHVLYSKDRTIGRDTPKPILIGDNVWVGMNAIILKGTIIGDNSVVAAGSVVKGHFPANSLIQGVPAEVVKLLEI